MPDEFEVTRSNQTGFHRPSKAIQDSGPLGRADSARIDPGVAHVGRSFFGERPSTKPPFESWRTGDYIGKGRV